MASTAVRLVDWIRRNVPWSNTRRAWLERGALVALVGAAAGLVILAPTWPLWATVLCWSILLLCAGGLWRRGWVSIFGPVLFYELLRSGRRSRTVLLRLLYILTLFGLLCALYYGFVVEQRGEVLRSTAIALFAMRFFEFFLPVQLGLVVLLTPIYVAGALSDEKERKTIEYVFTTDLRNREIVLGKFTARLMHVVVLVLAGLPILSAVQFLGGIDPDLLLAGFAGTGLTMLSVGGMSIFASALARRTRDALMLVYLALLFYFALWGLGELVLVGLWPVAPLADDAVYEALHTGVAILRAGNPIYAIFRLANTGTLDSSLIWSMLRRYAIFHGILALLGITGAMLLVRRLALATPRGAKGRTFLGLGWRRRLPAVGFYPMLWKEIWAERGARPHLLLRLLFILLSLMSMLPLVYLLWAFLTDDNPKTIITRFDLDPWDQLGRSVNEFIRPVGMLVAMLALLAVGIRAATSIRGEYQKDTMDALLTSPMGSEEILFGKWLGSVFCVRWLAAWLLALWSVGVVTGGISPYIFPVLILTWLVYAAAIASIGLWYSVVMRSSVKAIVATLVTFLAVSCGHWLPWMCCGIAGLYPGSRDAGWTTVLQIQACTTPEVVLVALPFRTAEFQNAVRTEHWLPLKLLIYCLCGTFCWAILAWGTWQIANERFKSLTGRHGRTVRQSTGAQLLSSWPENERA